MSWTTEVDWTDEDSLVNVPTGLVLDDLIAATNERYSAIGGSVPLGTNSPNSTALRDAMVACVTGGYLQPVDNVYDWTNQSELTRWDMTKMETELGAEPFYDVNAPITAAWVIWWYNALNLLTHCEYNLTFSGPSTQISFKQTSQAGWAAATADFASRSFSVWANWNGAFDPRQYAANPYGTSFILDRERFRTRDLDGYPFSPGSYSGNYTLNAWSRFTLPPSVVGTTPVYDNTDYPCDVDTYAQVWTDTDVQSGVYDKDITVGDIDTITANEPALGDVTGWEVNASRRVCRFDIDGGFDFVAPDPPP